MNFYVMFILPNMKKKDEITVLFFTKESSINYNVHRETPNTKVLLKYSSHLFIVFISKFVFPF